MFGDKALLGAQLVMTLIMVSVIQKLSPHYSLAKWILCSTGLIRFLHPTDNELKTLAGTFYRQSVAVKLLYFVVKLNLIKKIFNFNSISRCTENGLQNKKRAPA